MSLADMLIGQNSPFGQWAGNNSNFLTALGAGIGSGQNIQSGLSNALQMIPQANQLDTEAQRQKTADAKVVAQTNATQAWLEQNHPDLAQMVQAGMPVGEAWNMATERMKPQGGADMPANIREWEYYNALPPEDQSAYLRMKRSNPYLNLGTEFAQPDPANPGMLAGPTIPIDNRGQAADTAGGTVLGRETAERELQRPAVQAAMVQADAKTDQVMSVIDRAINMAGAGETGLVGSVMGAVPGSKAYDLRAAITTVKANLGFAELQAMRDASPTGGALGQVAVQELVALQSTLESLDPNQSEDQLKANLARVKELLERQKMYRQAAAAAKYSTPGVPSGNQTSTGVQWSVEP
jgi:hypothetical protein